jgi:hypothetical protein
MAQTLYERALRIFTRVLPARHPSLVRCRANWRRLQRRMSGTPR